MSAPITRRIRGFMQQRIPLMMTCREFEEFIADYLDGTLPQRQRLVFRLHLVFCRECSDYLASYERAIALGKSVFKKADDVLPEDIPEELVQAILAARRASQE